MKLIIAYSVFTRSYRDRQANRQDDDASCNRRASLSQSGRVEALAFRRRLQHARRRLSLRHGRLPYIAFEKADIFGVLWHLPWNKARKCLGPALLSDLRGQGANFRSATEVRLRAIGRRGRLSSR
jgi:hypothetical protein